MSKDAKERYYDIILAPLVTEKSTRGSEHNQVTFRVSPDATKPEIKKAVESLFEVKVKGVNTIRMNGKVKRFKGHLGQRVNWKKAIVSLAEGETIDMMTGV
ncbi:MAG: 50S ribosomal protein L23 [Rhodospirillaceae bacterium]|jgi:large subunit ribosomal protein L23|nr:50S ribosomal protein L23 [Rhodospirillaceae bacterium]MBT3926641.1 50S ribosomal protein L23 [Rhodospirillaceae bacterium]MBT4427854.1 50S ribosomal protein L23 [Rhodospirillaceae bacterium]MBT5040066.1 50S ribosomal protein L23 [Rhodospirillaceae bacterium]MBT5676553.1 50S ribosomal protein L23 [Rhodospirillaceae bacterium]